MSLFRKALTIVAALLAVAALVAVILYRRLPSARPRPRAAGVPAEEQARTIAALAPPKRARPVIAVIGDNPGAETTDYLVPFAVLTQSGVADVQALATGPGPLS